MHAGDKATSFSSLPPETASQIWEDLPRKSKQSLLLVSKYWKETALASPYLWNDLQFGPASADEDLHLAFQWLQRGHGVPVMVRIQRDESKGDSGGSSFIPDVIKLLTPHCNRIKVLEVAVSEEQRNSVERFISSCPLPSLERLVIRFSIYWGAQPPSNLPTPAEFRSLELPRLLSVGLSNTAGTLPWPASSQNLTEIVLGERFSLTFEQLKLALQSAPHLMRLGFYKRLPGIPQAPDGDKISVPALTSLSLWKTPVDSLQRLRGALSMPKLESLTISPTALDREDNVWANIGLSEIAGDLRALQLVDLTGKCDPGFFGMFPHLHTLGLDFLHTWMAESFWRALFDPQNSPMLLPMLRRLTLVGLEMIYAQELVLVRRKAGKPNLESLHIILPIRHANTARTPRWAAWIQRNVGTLLITDFDSETTYKSSRNPFAV